VHSVSRGVVVLADSDWSPDNLFSTTSRKGGNAVIVFDPDHERFYRYCHMSRIRRGYGHSRSTDWQCGAHRTKCIAVRARTSSAFRSE
jgi:hypothetical protein